MKTRCPGSFFYLFILVNFISSHLNAQSAGELMGRWEGVHYYGDTTRLYDGSLLVRATTIDSMKMILTIDELQEGKFKGKLHEQFYSDQKSYFNADVSGFIKNDEINFTSFDIKENKLPSGYRWCPPKATAVLVKSKDSYFLHMAFQSTLTCTVGPAIVERKISQNIAKTPAEKPQAVAQKIVTAGTPQQTPVSIQPKMDFSSIVEKFRARSRQVVSTVRVQSDSIKINFFDNGTVDGDSISVFINGELHASNVHLTTMVYSFYVHFEKGMDEIEVAMFAENLGTYPPNTALMQIVDGSKVHQAYLSSDTRSNAVIKIKKSK